MIRPWLWRLAKTTSVATAVAVLALLVLTPDLGLFLTWSVLVPAVPALLLVAPQVWRNLCPIAVVHQLPAASGRTATRRPGRRARNATTVVSGLLLFTIVPLRPALLNENGPALAGFVLAVLAISLAAGAIFAGKSGWCATWCPVLPVERLYGQDPLVSVTHAHCATCSACVRSCYDLKPQHSLDALLGRSASSILRTPTGVFAAGFPGFVAGYFTRPATAGLAMTYVWIAACVAGAVLALSLAQRVGQLRSASIARLAAALAAAAYYWFTVPDTARAAHALLHIPPASPAGITIARVLFLFLPGIWLLSATHRAGRDASIQGART